MSGVRGIIAPFGEVPDYFRKVTYSDIFNSSLKSENVQLVGLKGLGKSLILRLLESNQDKIKRSLHVKANVTVYLCDLSLISENSTVSILKHIFSRMLGFDKVQSLSPSDLTIEVQKYFDKIKSEGKRIIFVLDSIEKVEAYHNSEVFDFLHALYKQNIDNITFVFSVDSEIDISRARQEHGELGRLMFDRIIYLMPLNSKEEVWFLDSLLNMTDGFNLKNPDRNLIFENSGGYPVTIKRLLEAKISGLELSEVINFPEKLPAIAYNFEIMIQTLGDKIEVLKKAANGELKITGEMLEFFNKYYLIDRKGDFVNNVLKNYLKRNDQNFDKKYADSVGELKLKVKLTASEYKMLQYLEKNRGAIIKRDEIIEEIWGKKALNGVSDHALDQIASRLRKKLESSDTKIKMETLRGRGYRIG